MPQLDKAAAKGVGRPFVDVQTPELGDGAFIRVRCISALQRDHYETGFWKAVGEDKKPQYDAVGARGRLLAFACEWLDTGEPFFDSEDEACEFRCDVADRLFDAAQNISGMNATLEELKKAYGAAQAGATR